MHENVMANTYWKFCGRILLLALINMPTFVCASLLNNPANVPAPERTTSTCTTQPARKREPLFIAPVNPGDRPTQPDPWEVYPSGKAAIIAQMGAEIVEKFVTPLRAQYFEPSPSCIERPESCLEAVRRPYAMVIFRFRMPEVSFVDVDISCIVDRDLKVWELQGAPDCIDHPQECKFPIGEAAARNIATEVGLEPGLEPWRVKFLWNVSYKSYVWGISNTLHKYDGRVVLIDTNDGRVLETSAWTLAW